MIHFQPGARGDFLAAVLMEDLRARSSSAVDLVQNYTKVHYDFDPNLFQNHLRIRIDDNGLTDNVMQIVFNCMIKNPLESYHDQDPTDHFYVRVVDCLSKDRACPDHYHYWIDFQYLHDLDWLRSFFMHIHSRSPDPRFWDLVEQNVKQQSCWRHDPELEKLSMLIDYELRFNLFDWFKTFNVHHFLAHPQPRSLLCHENYSKQPFVI